MLTMTEALLIFGLIQHTLGILRRSTQSSKENNSQNFGMYGFDFIIP